MTAKDLVVKAIGELFTTRDVRVLDRYWSSNYVQHSSLAPDGIDGARALTSNLPPDFRYELARAIAEGDLVVTDGIYYGFAHSLLSRSTCGASPTAGLSSTLWRVQGGKLAEHWDVWFDKPTTLPHNNGLF